MAGKENLSSGGRLPYNEGGTVDHTPISIGAMYEKYGVTQHESRHGVPIESHPGVADVYISYLPAQPETADLVGDITPEEEAQGL